MRRRVGQFAAILEGAGDHQHAGQLPLRAGGGSQADRAQTGDLAEAATQLRQRAQGALDLAGRGLRVRLGQPRERRHEVVDLRVVLHGARAQRVGAGVDAVVPRREFGVVAHQFALAQFRAVARPRAAGGRRAAASASPSQRRTSTARRPGTPRSKLSARRSHPRRAGGSAHARPPISASAATSTSTCAAGVASVTAKSRAWRASGSGLSDTSRPGPMPRALSAAARSAAGIGPRTRNSENHGPRSGVS